MSEEKEFLEEEDFKENTETPEPAKKAKRPKIGEAIKGDESKASNKKESPKEDAQKLDASLVILYDKNKKHTFDIKKKAWEAIKKEQAELDEKIKTGELPKNTVHPYAHIVEANEQQIQKHLKALS